MSDPIDRQDAIDALKSLEFRQYMEFGEYIGEDIREVCLIRAEKAQDALQSLPSAQPKWIPVTERLPEEDVEVLVYLCEYNYFSPFIAWISKEDGMWHTSGSILEEDDNPIAWMPLPEPYKGEQE